MGRQRRRMTPKARHDTTTYELLRDGAARWPDRVLVRLENGESWTWAAGYRLTRAGLVTG